ncbi:neuronal acetylcholine receptor subunit alpha-5 isoform X2 [Monomorium pharaonis]|nr:neuronal acetylcholine receptor subunit alpha-5 isoform X2 [Monomorium pharaonis]XP_036143723.1 neuronal acetylcholine receptor subunit alpha-5 isoform X2 [Monomorium pharaonis]
MRLKKHLFCKYDFTVNPNYPNTTNITLRLIPSLIDMDENNAKLILHSLVVFSWMDTQLTWTPSDYEEINFIKIKYWQIWTPDLIVNNSADMSYEGHVISWKGCILFNSGEVLCVPMAKFISKCNPDYTYWPYDKHKCSITFISWNFMGDKTDLVTSGVNMTDFMDNVIWDFKYLNYIKESKKYMCCPNDTFSRITYNFLLTRHGKHHLVIITLAIVSILLTSTVLCLDLNSVERIAVASVNFIYHLLCTYFLHWNLPYNGVNPPNIMLFYRASMGLASFAIILTAFLRKLENMSTEVPNWISFITTFVLSYKAGRFLIFKNDKSKIADKDTVTEESLDFQKSEIIMKKLSWKHFAAIIDWLSFFCVIFTYIISLIILVPED